MSTDSKKYAVITMDVEDWYHTYFPEMDVDRSQSLLDGLDVALEIMEKKDIRGTFFVVGELADKLSDKLRKMDADGHEIACHNWVHIKPVTMTVDEFRKQLIKSRDKLEAILGHVVAGYRAPSFGVDDDYFQIIMDSFAYDSSKIKPQVSKKYGKLELRGFREIFPCIHRKEDFIEFEVSTLKIGGINILLGGGYLRMLPWPVIKWLTARYLKTGHPYVMYIHPIDLSLKPIPNVPDMGIDRYLRTHIGRRNMVRRVKSVIRMVEEAGYEFVTFEQLRKIGMEL